MALESILGFPETERSDALRKREDAGELLDVFSTNGSFEILHTPLLHELLLA